MSLDNKFVLNALLRFNYLPAQRKRKEEMPPVFSSATFTPEAAVELHKLKPKKGVKGFECVEYRSTRFNNISREYLIPHPVGYAQLARCIHDNWDEILPFQRSPISRIRPRQHADGRLIIMDYETFASRAKRVREMAFGQRFTVRTDISTCFPSIYSHAIPWAAVGLENAKKQTTAGWHNELDRLARRTMRNETHGVPIGPVTSNILAEIILSKVDEKLAPEFNYFRGDTNGASRFIDDYLFCCTSYDTARQFILRLEEELAVYKLKLNPKKTTIQNAITPFYDEWAVDLSLRVPSQDPVNVYHTTNYLDYAAALATRTPDGSVFKYAATALLKQSLDENAKRVAIDYLLIVAMQYPVLLPVLNDLVAATAWNSGHLRHPERYVSITNESAVLRRSDGMTWCLFYLARHKAKIPDSLIDAVMKAKDCIAMLMLYVAGIDVKTVIAFAKKLDTGDAYQLDKYWLLCYQLYLDGHIDAGYCSVPGAFEAMKSKGVVFTDYSALQMKN